MVLQNLQFVKTTNKSDEKKKSSKESVNDEGSIIYDDFPYVYIYIRSIFQK